MNYNVRFEPGHIYHVYNRVIGKELMFYHDRNYQYFLKKYFQFMSIHLDTLAYCLLPNHFHLLIRVLENADLDAMHNDFRRFFISYSKAINRQEDRKGSLFMKPYKRKKVDSNEYLGNITAYIHLNPWLHVKSQDYQSYPWSSFQSYLSRQDKRIEATTLLNWFGSTHEFVEFHQSSMEMEKDVDRYFL